MPMYDFHCKACRKTVPLFRKIINRDQPAICGSCGGDLERRIAAPRIVADYAGYSCPITGAWVEGRKSHRENLAKHGCRVLEPGEREAAERYRAKRDADLERSIGDTVEAEIHNMTPAKRDALAADLEHFSADVVRN